MTIRHLRAQHAAAHSAWLKTHAQKWFQEMCRLNDEIMKRGRPCRKNSGGDPRGKACSPPILEFIERR